MSFQHLLSVGAAGPLLSLDHIAGTPAYMAPEAVQGRVAQAARHSHTDSLGSYDAVKADAWGVEALVFYAATGEHLVPYSMSDSSCGGTAPMTSTCSPGAEANPGGGTADSTSRASSDGSCSSSDECFSNMMEVHSEMKVCAVPYAVPCAAPGYCSSCWLLCQHSTSFA